MRHRLKRHEGGPYTPKPGDTANTLIHQGVDIFALDIDVHNGPLCVDCGRVTCHHCTPQWWLTEECPARRR